MNGRYGGIHDSRPPEVAHGEVSLKKAQRIKGRASAALILESQGSNSIIQQILANSLETKPAAKRASRKTEMKIVADKAVASEPLEHKTSEVAAQKLATMPEEKRFIPAYRPKRGFVTRTVSGVVKSGFVLLPGVYIFNAMLCTHIHSI